MQPSNSLILLGIAVVASSAIGVSAAAAEPGMRHRQFSAAEREATSASSPSNAAPAQSATAAASPQPAPSPNPVNAEPPAWQSSPLQKRQFLKAQNPGEERLDQLQRESLIRQRSNQSQDSFDRPLAPDSDPLRVEQDIQRQLNLPSDSGNPAQRVDQLQYEQRLRQQLRQQRSPTPTSAPTPEPAPIPERIPEPQALASANSIETDLSRPAEATRPEQVVSELRPNKSAKLQPASQDSEPAEAEAQATPRESDREPEPTESELPDSEAAAQPEAQSENSDQEQEASKTAADRNAEDSSQASTQESSNVGDESAEVDLSREEAEELESAQTAPPATNDAPAPTGTPPALQDAPIPTEPPILEEAEEDRRDSIDIDNRQFSNDTPSPEYLDPDPNPLAFPTSPDEVEIVGTQPITLEQAVELALRNNAELRQAQLTLERTQAELRETQSLNFPTLGANANFNQQGSESAQRQPDVIPQGRVDADGNIVQVPVDNPNAGDIDVTYGDSTRLGAGLQLDYTIFTSGRRPALIEAARGQVRLQQLDIERQTEQLIFDTATNYYDLQEAGAQVNIFRANLAQAEQSLRDAQALERAGVGTRFDVLQAEVEVANARQDLTQQLSQLEISRRELAQQINISESLDISAADPIEVSGVWELSLAESIVQAYKNRVELEQSLIQREIAQRNRRAALAQLGPQVSFNGAFNVVNDFDNDFTFLHNYQLGLTVTQSLYDGGLARSQANQQESNISIAESEFENRRELIRFEVERAYSQLDANFANIQTTALAVEQAAEALRLARLRFQAGVGTQTDVLRQQTELARSQVNNLSAILSYNRAIIALERAVSNFPEGYLNDVP